MIAFIGTMCRGTRVNISCNGANFVAQQLGYRMTGGWTQGDTSSNDYYRPEETFADRFEALVRHVRSLGFSAMDLWTGQLNWKWATDAQLDTAAAIIERNGVRVTSYAGPFGDDEAELRRACRTIKSLGCNLLGGSAGLLEKDPQTLQRVLEEEEVLFAFENHPQEKSSADVMKLIGPLSEDVVGTVVDTGWYGTNGYLADRAIDELAGRLFLVHLKDVRAPGGHVTCTLGSGCVPVESCVQTLVRLGYEGTISIEHEPEDRDPAAEIVESRELVERMLAR